MLENGISLVLRVAYSQTLYFPFGEVIVFAMIFPHTKNVKKDRIHCIQRNYVKRH